MSRIYGFSNGCIAALKLRRASYRAQAGGEVSGCQIEELVDEAVVLPNIGATDPARPALADHLYRLISRKRSARSVERAKALLGFDATLDRAMVLVEDVVQVLDRTVTAGAVQVPSAFIA